MTTYYNIVYNNNFTFSKFRLENIDIIINKSHMSLCLTDNVFLFSQKEMISVFSTPGNSVTNFNPLIFYFIGGILSSIFNKKYDNNITK